MGTFVSSLTKTVPIAAGMLYLYKAKVLQPQGTLLAVLKSWLVYIFQQTRDIRLKYGTHMMLRDNGNVPVITFFHAPSDPHSTILLQALKTFTSKYHVRLLPKIVSPIRDRLLAGHSVVYDTQWNWARQDSIAVAKIYGLKPIQKKDSLRIDVEDFDKKALIYDVVLSKFVEQLFDSQISTLNGLTVYNGLQFLDQAIALGDFLFSSASSQQHNSNSTSEDNMKILFDTLKCMSLNDKMQQVDKINRNHQELKQLGHYLSGMLYLKPDFYWGVDRLFHLEQRLIRLGMKRFDGDVPTFVENYRLRATKIPNIQALKVRPPTNIIVMYYSFRSPYSQLAVDRIYKLGKAWGIKVQTKPVLPMVVSILFIHAVFCVIIQL